MTSQGQSIAAKAVEVARVAFNKDRKTLIVPPAIQVMQYEGIEKALAELGLKRSFTKRCIYNNKVMKTKTKRSCKNYFEGMNRFLTLIGDWESLLILLMEDLLKLGWLEGDEEGWAETLGEPDGAVDGKIEGVDDSPDEGALLKLGT